MNTKELIDALRNEDETDASAMMDYMADAADLLEKQQNKIGDLEYEAQEREKIVVQLRKQWQDAEMFICSMCGHFDRKTDGNIVYGNQDCGEIVGYPYCKKFTPWIPTSVRLPEVGGNYFVIVKYKYDFEKEYRYDMDFAEFTFSEGYIDNCWDTYNDWNEGQQYLHITHWMPIPEPPEELLEQLRLIFNINDDVNECMDAKVWRLEERLGGTQK